MIMTLELKRVAIYIQFIQLDSLIYKKMENILVKSRFFANDLRKISE